MADRFWDEAIECMPLPELVGLAERTFVERRVMERASQSPLYKGKWAEAGIKPESVRAYDDLKAVPYVTGEDLRSCQMTHDPDQIVCCDSVRYWISTSGTTGAAKWIPRADKDVETSRELESRNVRMRAKTCRGDTAAVVLTAPAPFVSDSEPYVSAIYDMFEDFHVEMVLVNYTEAEHAFRFALDNQVQILAGFPSIAMRLAEGIAERAPRAAQERLEERFSLRNLLAVLITSVREVKPRHLMKLRCALFSGEPLDPYRRAIADAYGVESYEMYTFSEFLAPMSDCWAHDGIHIWMDACIPEVIPESEVERGKADPRYLPQAVPLWEAPAGLRGEYVVTSFSEALPLVRYRTADLIQVVGIAPCRCGRTHPRIRVLHRADDIVNLGIMRFSIFDLHAKLAEVEEIGRWQLRITREDYKPKAILLLEPAAAVDEEALVGEVLDRVLEIEVLRLGLDNDLIAEPEIRLIDELEEEETSTGKLRLAVYEDAYYGVE